MAPQRAAGACLLAAVGLAGLSTLAHPWPVPDAAATARTVAASPTWLAAHLLLLGMAAAATAGVALLHRALRRGRSGPRGAGGVLAGLGFGALGLIALAEMGPFHALAGQAAQDPAQVAAFAAAYDLTLRAFDAGLALAGLGLAGQGRALAAAGLVGRDLSRAGVALAGLGALLSAASAAAPAPGPIWLGAAGMGLVMASMLVLGGALVGAPGGGPRPERPAVRGA